MDLRVVVVRVHVMVRLCCVLACSNALAQRKHLSLQRLLFLPLTMLPLLFRFFDCASVFFSSVRSFELYGIESAQRHLQLGKTLLTENRV